MRKTLLKNVALPVLAGCFCLNLFLKTYAKDSRTDIPDLTIKGSISVTICSGPDDEPITGGTLTLYRIGSYIWLDSRYLIQIEDEFKQKDYYNYLYPENLDADKAREYMELAMERGIGGNTRVIGEDGEVGFDDLSQGLYLLVQKEAPDGYRPVNPFFVTLPLYDSATGYYLCDVDASPKMQKLEPIVELTPLEPAMVKPAELTPAIASLIDAVPSDATPSDAEPSESITPDPGTSESGTDEAKPTQPLKTASHRGSGSPSATVPSQTDIPDTVEAEEFIYPVTPLAPTGQGRKLLAAAAIFILSGTALAVVSLRHLKRGGR